MNTKSVDHISICIASYKRPALLQQLLNSLKVQKTDGKFQYSIIVVDNDIDLSAQEIVLSSAQGASVLIQYFSQPIQNISLARNHSVRMGKGNLIAFIDDDEYASKEWLLNLYKTMRRFNCQVAHGPVFPSYDPAVSTWIKRTKYFEPKGIKTGASIYEVCATNNCLLERALIDAYPEPFNPKYGLTGGEDTDFFQRLKRSNIRFCWCQEAIVYEYVGPLRAQIAYIARRSFRGGNGHMTLKLENANTQSKIYNFALSFLKLIVFFLMLPLFLLMGALNPEYAILFTTKIFGFIGQMSAFFKVKYIQYRFPV